VEPSTSSRPSRLQINLVLGAGLLAMSCAAIFIRLARDSANSSDAIFGVLIAAGRIAVAALIATPYGLRTLASERHELEPRVFKKALWLAIFAGFALAAHFTFWIVSLGLTSIAASTAIVTSNPLWLSLYAWLILKQKPSPIGAVGLLVTFFGGALIGVGDASGRSAFSDPLLGDGLALFGAFGGSAYYLLGQTSQRLGLSLRAYAGVAYGTAALVLAPLPALFGVPYFAHPLETYLWIVLLGLIPQLIGHTSVNWAVKYLAPALVASVVLLEPIGSAVGAMFLFREIPGAITILGGLVVLFGIVLVVRAPKTATRAAATPQEISGRT
jgi:drug/metabolite transporter (DMT)-like permease